MIKQFKKIPSRDTQGKQWQKRKSKKKKKKAKTGLNTKNKDKIGTNEALIYY